MKPEDAKDSTEVFVTNGRLVIDRKIKAFHEAGHVVSRFYLCGMIESCTIIPLECGKEGATFLALPDLSKREDIITLMAGEQMAQIAFPDYAQYSYSNDEYDDEPRIERLLYEICGSNEHVVRNVRNKFKDQTIEILTKPRVRSAAYAIATALLDRGTLSGEDAKKIYDQTCDDKQFG
jgi:hypothetical protein